MPAIINEIDIVDDIRESYSGYAYAVISERAISNTEDNQKPSSLTVLYAMDQLGISSSGKHVKVARIVGEVLGKYHPHGECLRNSTKVYCLDGTSKTIKEITESGISNIDILAFDENEKSIKPAKAHSFRITKHTNKIYKIKLYGGGVIECTDNHPFYDIIKNEWIRTDELHKGSMLMCASLEKDKYLKIRTPYLNQKHLHNYLYDVPNISTYVRHHVNFIKTDNRPDNIQILTKSEHRLVHEIEDERNRNKYHEGLAKGRDTMQLSEYKDAHLKRNKILTKQLNDKIALVKTIALMNDLYKMGVSLTVENYKKYRHLRYNSPILERTMKKTGLNWSDLLKIREEGIKLDVSECVNIGPKLYKKTKVKLKDVSNIKSFNAQYGSIIKVIKYMVLEEMDLTWSNYDLARNVIFEKNKLFSVPSSQPLMYTFNTLDNLIGILGKDGVLQVVKDISVEDVDEDVYDFTVDKYHNMLINVAEDNECIQLIACHNSSVTGTIVNMAQDFNNNIPYIDPNGNFGSIAGDSAAAPRYIEAKLSWYAEKIILKDLAKGVVEYKLNYDDTTTMPTYLPEVLPDLLINGNMGIGVGFASYLIPHNLNDVIELCINYVKNRSITPDQMFEIIKGPDFPLGGIINGTDGLKRCYTSGDGYVRVRGEYKIEEDKKGNQRIVITSIPYGSYIPDITVAIGTLVENGELNIKDIRDETTQKEGMRICIDLAKGESVNRVISLLIHKTPFEKTLKPLHNLLIKGKFKEKVNIKDIMESFIDFRETCLHNKFMIELKKNQDRLHILEGLFIVTKDIDKAVKIIRNAKDNQDAKSSLIKAFSLSEVQAQYILDLKLARLTKLNMSDARDEEKDVKERIKTLIRLTRSKSNKDVDEYMIKEWEEIRNLKEAKPYLTRKTKIQKKRDDITEEDTIPDAPCTIIMTQKGYIKRVDVIDKEQKRGGKGNSIGTLLEGDEIKQVLNVTARQQLVFLTSKGRVYTKKAYEIDSVSKLARGALTRNILSLRDNENVVLCFVNDNEFGTLISCSVKGMVKSTDLKNLKKINANGKNLIGVDNADKIVDIVIIPDSSKERDVLIATHNGMCIRIDSNEIKPTGIGAVGVVGIKLDKEEKDFVSSMCRVDGDTPVIFVTESGYIKRVHPDEFKVQNRNGVGVKCTQTKYNNRIVAMVRKKTDESILIYTKMGKSLVCETQNVKLVSRNALGVKGIDLQTNDIVIGIS